MFTSPRLTALLSLLSAVNLALMIPGGAVETRIFPDYPIAVLALFNVFLTALGLGSLILAWTLWRQGKRVWLASLAGLAFALVYIVDLAEVFPVSDDPMSTRLYTLEWVGVALGLALFGQGARASGTARDPQVAAPVPRLALAALGALGLGIIGFATLATQ